MKGAPIVRPVKRGISIRSDQEDWIYRAHRLTNISENKIIGRLIDIGIQDLRPFDDAGLKRILSDPWQVAKKIPALQRQMTKRDRSSLSHVTATRLTAIEKAALRDFARKNRTTMSQIQRQVLERLLAGDMDHGLA